MDSLPPSSTDHRSTIRRRHASTGVVPQLVPVSMVAAIVAATIVSVLAFSSARTLAGASDQETRADQLVELKAELSWLHHELLISGVLAYQRTGTATRPEGFDRLLTERSALIERVDDLAGADDPVGVEAASISQQMTATPIVTWPIDLWSIEKLHYDTMPFLDRPFEVGERATGGSGTPSVVTGVVTTADLIAAAQAVPLPRMVLLDALALDLTGSTDPLPPWAGDFLDSVATTANENAGWFGPDPDRPLADHVLGPPGAQEPPLVNVAAEQVSASLDLVTEYDRWLIAGGASTGPPPATIEELAAASERTSAAMIEAVRDGFALANAERDGSTVGRGSVVARFLLGGLAAGVAVALIVLGLTWWNRRRHHLADAAYTDPLTGAGNRRFLDDVVAGRLRRSGQTHMVAMLDMDRFKLVNDTWGHDAGDALLGVLSHRLHHHVEAFCQARPGSSYAVIRLGGDEFLVVAHGPVGLDTDVLAHRLRSIAGPVDLGLEDDVDLAFSLGLAVADEPCQLADLLKSADLATYEDKQASFAPTGPPVVVDVASLEGG